MLRMLFGLRSRPKPERRSNLPSRDKVRYRPTFLTLEKKLTPSGVPEVFPMYSDSADVTRDLSAKTQIVIDFIDLRGKVEGVSGHVLYESEWGVVVQFDAGSSSAGAYVYLWTSTSPYPLQFFIGKEGATEGVVSFAEGVEGDDSQIVITVRDSRRHVTIERSMVGSIASQTLPVPTGLPVAVLISAEELAEKQQKLHAALRVNSDLSVRPKVPEISFPLSPVTPYEPSTYRLPASYLFGVSAPEKELVGPQLPEPFRGPGLTPPRPVTPPPQEVPRSERLPCSEPHRNPLPPVEQWQPLPVPRYLIPCPEQRFLRPVLFEAQEAQFDATELATLLLQPAPMLVVPAEVLEEIFAGACELISGVFGLSA